ncbi:MAG TPA: protein-L-isoaspartate(D-aspartate) O-methyltransferase [Acholeplasmataceae bacterium]|jgi:protein-L-isoaspartate(D-aspartate) O-methyltransferase|nr:protein-L-isoaspartate(D-aspartate) O-methyltransferase [Acholeplasmataceae bacterium]
MDKKKIKEIFHSIDRSFFLGKDERQYAFLNMPLPIGYGQTISQPSLVLKMTQLLLPTKENKVLEIGTGSGFQTAILAKIADKVYTVERIKQLMEVAKEKLDNMNFTNIFYKVGDGTKGWKEHAPYDRIMVTAAASAVPDDLVNQLAKGGRMVIPVGTPNLQELKLITKSDDSVINIKSVGYVRFVELIGKYGWKNR